MMRWLMILGLLMGACEAAGQTPQCTPYASGGGMAKILLQYTGPTLAGNVELVFETQNLTVYYAYPAGLPANTVINIEPEPGSPSQNGWTLDTATSSPSAYRLMPASGSLGANITENSIVISQEAIDIACATCDCAIGSPLCGVGGSGKTPGPAGAASTNWLMANLICAVPPTPTPTATPSPTPKKTVKIKHQIDRAQLQFPIFVKGTPVADTAARALEFNAGFTCTQEWVTVQGQSVPVLRCQVP